MSSTTRCVCSGRSQPCSRQCRVQALNHHYLYTPDFGHDVTVLARDAAQCLWDTGYESMAPGVRTYNVSSLTSLASSVRPSSLYPRTQEVHPATRPVREPLPATTAAVQRQHRLPRHSD